eukprot:TRINITY_DN4304_c0_g2_i1.p1 TRINITY_DN4304_c0_g2~~TRINITY_DN4304_c0_g2_i1.p1  ORF type:complete len:752 (+),score=320.34 TRINITY_DN4304_c0_g2_i1:113-2368(+)
MSDLAMDERWVEIQHKTFTRWTNTHLRERMLKIDNLETDLADGTMLLALLEIISSKTVAARYSKNPRIKSQMLENVQYSLDFLRKEGIKLVNIGAEDIVDKKLKLILGLIWTVILRYQIHIEQGKSARSDLLNWVRSKIPEYNINNFTRDWNDGRAICGLTNALKPGLIPDHFSRDPADALANATLGEDTAEKDLGIPKVLGPEDMIKEEVDELSVMTYISYFRDWEANEAKRKGDAAIEKTPVAGKCKAYGPGLEKAELTVPTEFTIEAINANNRRVPEGGAPFNVEIKGTNGTVVPHEFVDNNDGTYKVHYTPPAVDTLTVEIKLEDTPINGNPWRVTVNRTLPDADKTRAYGPGLESGVANSTSPFTVEIYNRFGTRVPDGGDKIEVKVVGPHDSVVSSKVVDNQDGSYSASYDPKEPGEHTVTVSVNGAPVKGSPFKVTIDKDPEGVDAATTVAYGPGLEHANTAEPAVFTVETRKPNGDRYTKAGALVDVWVEDANGQEVPANKTDNGDGSFTVAYEPKETGETKINVVVRNPAAPTYYDHIKGSTFTVNVEAGVDASQSIAYGPGLENGNVYDTLPTHFFIQAKDRQGRNITDGGAPYEVKIVGPNGDEVPADIKDNGDGTYQVDYAPQDAGKHLIEVNLNGGNIKDAPFTISVLAGADESNSEIECYQFTLRAKTKKGEPKTTGGDKFVVDVTAPDNSVTDAQVQDVGDGSYVVTYALKQKGENKVNVRLNGKHIAGSPFVQHA